MDTKKILSVLDVYDKKLEQYSRNCSAIKPERADPTKKYFTSSEEGWAKMSHVWWAIGQCRIFVAAGRMEKAFRWLGFIQGAFWFNGTYSVEELANHNKPAGEETNLDPSRR